VTEELPPPPPPPVDVAWLVEPRRPARVRRSPHGPWFVVAAVSIGAFMGQLDASIVTLALPPIQRHFHATLAGVEWVSLAYLLALVVLVVPVGRVADMLGRKLLYVYGFVVFTAGSVACGLAPSVGALVGFRVVQAFGAALLQANSVALIATAVPRERLGRAIGIQGAAQAVGLAAGPAVGGVLVSAAGWRWVFLVNAPVGVLGVVAGLVLLPRTRTFSPRVPFDWLGLVAFSAAVGAGLFALSYLREEQRSAPALAAVVAVAAVAAVAFLVRTGTVLARSRRRPAQLPGDVRRAVRDAVPAVRATSVVGDGRAGADRAAGRTRVRGAGRRAACRPLRRAVADRGRYGLDLPGPVRSRGHSAASAGARGAARGDRFGSRGVHPGEQRGHHGQRPGGADRRRGWRAEHDPWRGDVARRCRDRPVPAHDRWGHRRAGLPARRGDARGVRRGRR
jgi:MFS family permease